jgi:putative NADH-flavin reductase
MKLAVFGSTGGTGRLILTEALRRGHEVTAFARNAGALAGITGLAGIVEGDGREGDAAAAAVAGQDAVIMTVSGRGEPDVATDIARAVTTAMAAAGVARLVATKLVRHGGHPAVRARSLGAEGLRQGARRPAIR